MLSKKECYGGLLGAMLNGHICRPLRKSFCFSVAARVETVRKFEVSLLIQDFRVAAWLSTVPSTGRLLRKYGSHCILGRAYHQRIPDVTWSSSGLGEFPGRKLDVAPTPNDTRR